MLKLTLLCAQVAQAELRHARECSPSAQVKAAATHVQTLKRNQRKKKLSVTYVAERTNEVVRDSCELLKTAYSFSCDYNWCKSIGKFWSSLEEPYLISVRADSVSPKTLVWS
jgi:hypothetical protein